MGDYFKIGHRGAKGHKAENTLESIETALKFRVDAVEVDVHKCKTGELVVIHDFTLDRTTNGSGDVAQTELVELRSLKIDGGYRIPLLTEVLELIEGRCRINIELKGSETAGETCRIIHKFISERSWKYEDFIVSSFQKNELYNVEYIDEKIPIGVLSKASVNEAIALGRILKATYIHPSLGIITQENVRKCHEGGFKVNVWTVNEARDIERMRYFGVDGIISDFPDRL